MRHTPLASQILSPLLIASFVLTPELARPEAAAPATSISTNAVSGLNSVLGSLNSLNGAFGAGTAQVQGLANQLMGAQTQANGLQTPQSQFDQIGMQLQDAIFNPQTGVQACITKATRDYAKYHKKQPKAGNVTPTSLTSMEPTCSTSAFMMDAIAVNKQRMHDVRTKVSCMASFQSRVTQIAEGAKAPFQQLTNAAVEVYKTHSQIIDIHKKSACKLWADVDGMACDENGVPQGEAKGGYRAQLNNLKALNRRLNTVIGGKAGNDKDGGVGLTGKIDDLQTKRSTLGVDWYYKLMGEVEYCFSSVPAPCFDNSDGTVPPAQCVAALVNNESKANAGARVRGNTNNVSLQNIGALNYAKKQKINVPANLDIAKPGDFLAFARKRFDESVSSVVGQYGSHNFKGRIDKGKIKDAIVQGYNACWDQAASGFNADLVSKGQRYYSSIADMRKSEGELMTEIQDRLDEVKDAMESFGTSFHKVYNVELAQFKTDCSADGDPYRGLDCLKVFKATLESGIEGTRRPIKLGNGSQFTSFAGDTVIPIDTITLDAAGKPTMGTTNMPCKGFNECLQFLTDSRTKHGEAADKSTEERKKFVETHNTAVRSAFTTISGHFGTMSQLITSGVSALKGELAHLGMSALTTKEVEGEQLKENEKTGMIDMPKSMKAALAGQNSFTEIGNADEVLKSYNEVAKDLNKKLSEAANMKNKCEIKKEDYAALADRVGKDCSNAKAVCGADMRSATGALEIFFNKARDVPDTTVRSTSSSNYAQCEARVMKEAQRVTTGEILKAGDEDKLYDKEEVTRPGGKKDIKRTRNADEWEKIKDQLATDKEAKAEAQAKARCMEPLFQDLDAAAQKGRTDDLKNHHSSMIQGLRNLAGACAQVAIPKDGKESEDTSGYEAVTAACEDYKDTAKKGAPPPGEEVTKVADETPEPAKPLVEFPKIAPSAK